MKNAKRIIAVVIAVVMMCCFIAACTNNAGEGTATAGTEEQTQSTQAPETDATEPTQDVEQPAQTEAVEAVATEATEDSGATAPSGELVRPEPISSDETVNISAYPEYKKRAEGDEMTFALLLFSRGFEWMIGLQKEFESTCAELGVKSVVLDAQGSDDTQMDQIQDMITQGVDAIILTPNSNDGLIAGVKAAKEAGVFLATCEGVVEGGIVPVEVQVDNFQMGEYAAEYVADKLGGKGKVLECRGALASLSSQDRHNGFVKTMEKYPDIEVIVKNTEWVSTEAAAATQDVLTANPDLGAIYSHNDEMQTGIQSALREMGRTEKVGEDNHIVLVGIDGTPLGLERLREGIQDACVVQDPFDQGKYVATYTYNFLMGKDVPKMTMTQPYVVTQEFAAIEELWGNFDFSGLM